MKQLPKIALGVSTHDHVFKPVLFEFPTYEYFVTGDKVGNCGRMN